MIRRKADEFVDLRLLPQSLQSAET